MRAVPMVKRKNPYFVSRRSHCMNKASTMSKMAVPKRRVPPLWFWYGLSISKRTFSVEGSMRFGSVAETWNSESRFVQLQVPAQTRMAFAYALQHWRGGRYLGRRLRRAGLRCRNRDR